MITGCFVLVTFASSIWT